MRVQSDSSFFFFIPIGTFAMYDVHYLCKARYESGQSCPPRVSSPLCDCVKLSSVLTMSMSFRSNVNYIPPPQEVSCLFFLCPPLPSGFPSCWVHERSADSSVSHLLMNVATFLIEITTQPHGAVILNRANDPVTCFFSVFPPQDFKHTQSFML